MLVTFTGAALFASLHSAAPGATGANEIAGAGPSAPYARQPVTWGSPASGSVTTTAAVPSFQWPAGLPLQYFGLWDAITAGTFAGAWALGGFTPTPFTAAAAGDIFTSEDHGLTDGQTVVLIDTSGGTLPEGFAEEMLYFVISATTDTFQLSLTSGGAAIDVTDAGVGFVVRNRVEAAPVSASIYQLSSVTADLAR